MYFTIWVPVWETCKYVFDHSLVMKCVGIEYDEDRYLESLPLVKKESNRFLTFEHGNFLDKNWSDATIIFMDSIGYTTDTLEKIEQKICATCLSIRYILSMKKLSTVSVFRLIKHIPNIPASWGLSQCYVYVKPPAT